LKNIQPQRRRDAEKDKKDKKDRKPENVEMAESAEKTISGGLFMA